MYMGYTKDNPPEIVREILEEYNLEIKECGYNGSWAKVRLENDRIQYFRREVTNNITLKQYARGEIKTQVTNTNVFERDQEVGEKISEKLGGYDTLVEALDENF